MTTTEIILNMLAETATKEISKQEDPSSFDENRKIAGNARKDLEKEIGHSVISEKNASEIHATEINSVVTNLMEETSQITNNDKE